MNHAIRSIRTHHRPAIIFSFPPHRETPLLVKLRQVNTGSSSKPENQHNMDKAQNPKEKTGDVMSHSFGEGYATRSDEEGFGGVYGGNRSANKVEMDKEIHENHPAYDKSQGSEVKQKEKARHQTNAQS